MARPIALILADDPARRRFMGQCFEQAGMVAIAYPRPGAYVLELERREPQVLVVDLQLPVEAKLEVVRNALSRYPRLKVITVGKREYLEQQGMFRGQTNVAMCDRIEELAV